jgi:hypothetical protein
LDFAVDEYLPNIDWPYQLFITEGAESYFGTDVFKSLEARFASIPGIDRVHHEDREVFIIKTGLPRDKLAEALWSHILSASEATELSIRESDSIEVTADPECKN